MKRTFTPVETRSGWITGRVFTVLVVSSFAAAIALAVVWVFLPK